MKRIAQIIILIALLMGLTGCLEGGQQEEKFTGAGLSISLSLPKEVARSSPINILAKIKNTATENATDIYVYLTGLEGWKLDHPMGALSKLMAKDTHTFSWVAYAPKENKTYNPKLELFYKMKTSSTLVVRIYNNDYLNMLKHEERDRIKSKSALLSFKSSIGTPITTSVNIREPFVITSDYQDFKFIVDLKNVGGGTVYNPSSTYQLLSVLLSNQTLFTAKSNYTISCEVGTGNILSISTSRSVVCKIPAKKVDIGNYIDVSINIGLDYAYLYSVHGTIVVK